MSNFKNTETLKKLEKIGYVIREDCFKYVTFDNGKTVSTFSPCTHNYNAVGKYLQDIECTIKIGYEILNMGIDNEFIIDFYANDELLTKPICFDKTIKAITVLDLYNKIDFLGTISTFTRYIQYDCIEVVIKTLTNNVVGYLKIEKESLDLKES